MSNTVPIYIFLIIPQMSLMNVEVLVCLFFNFIKCVLYVLFCVSFTHDYIWVTHSLLYVAVVNFVHCNVKLHVMNMHKLCV